MVIEPNNLDQIVLFLLVLLQFLLDDLFEAVDDELLDKGRCCFLSHDKLLVGFGVELKSLHVEEGEGDVQFGATGEFLYPLLVHPLDLDYQQFAVLVHLRQQFFLLGFLHFDWAVVFNACLDVLLYVSHQQHVGVLVVLPVVDQF